VDQINALFKLNAYNKHKKRKCHKICQEKIASKERRKSRATFGIPMEDFSFKSLHWFKL